MAEYRQFTFRFDWSRINWLVSLHSITSKQRISADLSKTVIHGKLSLVKCLQLFSFTRKLPLLRKMTNLFYWSDCLFIFLHSIIQLHHLQNQNGWRYAPDAKIAHSDFGPFGDVRKWAPCSWQTSTTAMACESAAIIGNLQRDHHYLCWKQLIIILYSCFTQNKQKKKSEFFEQLVTKTNCDFLSINKFNCSHHRHFSVLHNTCICFCCDPTSTAESHRMKEPLCVSKYSAII